MTNAKDQIIAPKVPNTEIEDNGKVRLGGAISSFPNIESPPKNIRDTGKVRIGGASPF